MAIFFTGCTHFGHKNIISLASRPFETVEEMDEVLIENWNKTVKPGDHVYHLGDFAWKDHDAYSRRLNGAKFIIKGNHDHKSPLGGVHYEEIPPGICLFHYPIEEWNGWYKGILHLHCHTHKHELVSAPRRFNVTVEATEYRPISMDEIFAHPNSESTQS